MKTLMIILASSLMAFMAVGCCDHEYDISNLRNALELSEANRNVCNNELERHNNFRHDPYHACPLWCTEAALKCAVNRNEERLYGCLDFSGNLEIASVNLSRKQWQYCDKYKVDKK
jgi:hypothetical protein